MASFATHDWRRADNNELVIFELGKYLGKKGWFGVEFEHFAAQFVDNQQSSVPEVFMIVALAQKWLQRIGDLVAHVGVGQIQGCHHDGLQFVLRLEVLVDELAQQHVEKHNIGRIDEGYLLPALNEQRPVDTAQPADRLRGLKLSQIVASHLKKIAQALHQFRGGSLQDNALALS